MTTRQTLVALSLLAIPLSASAQNDKLNGKIYSDAKPVSIRNADSLANSISGTRRNAITRAVERVSPAVVGINVTEIREQRYYDPYQGMFNDPVFRQFFGNRGGGARVEKYQVQNLGSGFIISSDGYILTNDHVAGNASKIIITTVGGKQYDAQLIATDVVSDIALLKINADNLPFIPLGNSEDLAVGEWAIAMGNPFGLFRTNDKPTVTVGVISNTGVNLGIENGKNFRDMIQTDAAISSGNSGGPLLNANGDVIGINATIYSTSQDNKGSGSIGLGFAIPINKVKSILNEFKSGRKIDRNIGNLGFMGQTLNDELKEYIGIKADEGVVVTNLYRNSIGERAGLQPGDLITGIDGERVRTFEDLQSIIADRKVGDVVKFTVLRSEGQFTLPSNFRQIRDRNNFPDRALVLLQIITTMDHFRSFLSLALVSLLTLTSCADKASMPGKAFEGRIIQKLTFNAGAFGEIASDPGSTGSNAQGAQSMMSGLALKADVIMYVKADKLAYEMSMLGGLFSFRSIIDPMTRKLTFISTAEKKAYVADLKDLDTHRNEINDSLEASNIIDSLAKMAPHPTGKKEEINGFDCEQYVTHIEKEGKKLDMEMWITTDPRLKFYDVMRDALIGKRPTGSGGLEQLMAVFQPFAGKGKVPVRMTMKINGKDLMTSEMTEMVEEKLDNKYFEVPQGFQVVEQGAKTQKRDSI